MRLPPASPSIWRGQSGTGDGIGIRPSRLLARQPATHAYVPWLELWIVANCLIFDNMFCCPCEGSPNGLCCYASKVPTDTGFTARLG
jgi:hypothetical protein